MRERCFLVAIPALILGIMFSFLAFPSEELSWWEKEARQLMNDDVMWLMKLCFGLGGVMLLAAFIIGPSKE